MGTAKDKSARKFTESIAAGGVVYRIGTSGNYEVLLIFRNGVWDLPKGKLEKGESIPMCAAREVSEEVGAPIPHILSDLGTTYHEYDEKKKRIGKTTWWYSMVLPACDELKPQEQEGITRLEWADAQEAIDKVGYENLRKVLRKFIDIKKA